MILKNKNIARIALLPILAAYYLLILIVYIPNMGGAGLNLPQNILSWIVIEVIVLIGGMIAIWQTNMRWDMPLVFFATGAMLLTLPLLWSPSSFRLFALARFAGLVGGVIFYLALLQYSLDARLKRHIVMLVVAAAALQCALVIYQASQNSVENMMEFVPGTRPYGIFQQVNVLASFIATGYCCAGWLLYRARSWGWRWVWLSAIALFVVMLDLLQSRAGIIGALLYTLFILAIRFRARHKGMFTLLVAVVSLSLLALHIIKFYGSGSAFLQHFGSVEKGHSTLERWIMIKTSWKMIVAHPFSGWGYGSFEYIASRFSLANYQHLLNADHPHNEVLFEWAEGGLLALAGMITIVVGAMWMLRRAPRSGIALWGVMLPIVFHMMVEYPLLQSVPHWFTLLLLCRLAVCRRAFTLPKRSLKISWLMPATAAAGLIFMLTGFKTGSVLTAFERGGMQDFTAASAVINPWIQWDRWQYDEHSALLIRYNQTRDPALLERYSQWAMCYLERRNDLQVFENIARINKFDPRTERTQWLNRQWREYYVTLAGALQQNNRQLQQ